jgi:5'-3' exonuclease
MESSSSPLASNYHLDFKMDPNNKPASMRWLWVAKLNFMNTKLLVEELSKLQSGLTNEEKIRNSFRDVEIFFPASYRVVTSSSPTTSSQWRSLIGGNVDGMVSTVSSQKFKHDHEGGQAAAAAEGEENAAATETNSSSSSSRYFYKLSPFQSNRSMIHTNFLMRALPIPWTALQWSMPQKPVRLPVNRQQLEYIVRTHGGAYDGEYAEGYQGYDAGAAAGYGGYGGYGGGGGGYGGGRGGYGGGGGGGRGGGNGGGGGDSVCWYFNSPKGCGYGAKCRFSHISN